jgi:predicted ArsR family transcriptional regulator
LTEAADQLFPQGYGELARHLVSEVKDTMGAEEAEAMFGRIAERIVKDAPPPVEGQSFEDRLDQVVDFMEKQGCISHWEKTDGEYVFTNINCPYRHVSREHAEVCYTDTGILTAMLGVVPRRLSSMRTGDNSCSFLVVPPEA